MQKRKTRAREEEGAKAVRAVSGPDALVHTGRDLGTLAHERRDLLAVGRAVARTSGDGGQEKCECEDGREGKTGDAYR